MALILPSDGIRKGSLSVQSFALHRLARLKFELTNQDSVGGKTCTVLTSMYVNRKGIEIGQLFSLEMALNINEKGYTIPKTISDCKKWKI